MMLFGMALLEIPVSGWMCNEIQVLSMWERCSRSELRTHVRPVRHVMRPCRQLTQPEMAYVALGRIHVEFIVQCLNSAFGGK